MSKHICENFCVDHWEETELTCPYCLHQESDSWEILRGEDNESGTTQCGECEEEYEYGATISYRNGGVESIKYSTYPKEVEL